MPRNAQDAADRFQTETQLYGAGQCQGKQKHFSEQREGSTQVRISLAQEDKQRRAAHYAQRLDRMRQQLSVFASNHSQLLGQCEGTQERSVHRQQQRTIDGSRKQSTNQTDAVS